jgi:hypothetical protein
MLRRLAVTAIILSCSIAGGWAQSPSAPSGPAPGNPVTKKPDPKATAAAKPAAAVDSGPCQIGVIPIAGNLFLIERFGLFKFNDSYQRVAVDGWALDDLVVSRVRAAMPGSSVRRIPFTKEELVQFPRSLFSSADATAFAQRVGARISCERYVVVHRHGGGKREYGIGISSYGPDKPAHLFAMMYIRVYDGRTFELIKEGRASITDESLIARAYLNPVGGPYRALDSAAFPDGPAHVAGNPVLRDGVRGLLTESLDKTLPALLQ